MSGLTIDRTATVTAAKLNTLWNTIVQQVSYTLPSSIRSNSDGDLFDDIELNEGSDLASNVFEPIDVLVAMSISGTSNFSGAFSVLPNTTDDGIKDGRTAIIVRSIKDNVTLLAETTGLTLNASSGFDPNLDLRGNDKYLVSKTIVALTSIDSYSISGLTRYITNTGIGWYSDSWSSVSSDGVGETFNGIGYTKWGSGVGTTLTSSTFNKDDFLSGYNYWYVGVGTTFGEIETFDVGFSQGITPDSGNCSSSELDLIQEDLTTQVTGSNDTFTVLSEYETDSLRVYWNGQRQEESDIKELPPLSFKLDFTPSGGTSIIVDYLKK